MFLKASRKKQKLSMDIHFETSNKLAPLLTENTDDVTKCSSTNIASANSKKSHPIKLISQFSVSLKIILKVSHQIQYLVTSSMPLYQRMAVKFSLQATVMSNELEESILIKNIELAKLIFVHSAVQQVSSRITISNHHFLMISQMLLLST